MVFSTTAISWIACGRGGVGHASASHEGGIYPPLGYRQQHCTSSSRHKQPQLIGQDGRWQQFSSTYTVLLVPLSGTRGSKCSAPSWFDRVGKKLPVKANLAIYSKPYIWRDIWCVWIVPECRIWIWPLVPFLQIQSHICRT